MKGADGKKTVATAVGEERGVATHILNRYVSPTGEFRADGKKVILQIEKDSRRLQLISVQPNFLFELIGIRSEIGTLRNECGFKRAAAVNCRIGAAHVA